MKKILPLLTLLFVSLSAGLSAATPKYKNPTPGEFPILAWYSIRPDSAQTEERYRELREAGFNISFSHFYHDEQIQKALDASKGTGIKIMPTSNTIYSDTKNSVAKFKSHPGIAGWFLRDEPVASGFKDLSDFRDRIMDADSTHILYLNLFPSLVGGEALGTKDYEEYVQRFVDEVRLPLISFDFYPVCENKDAGITYVRESLYDNMEIVAKVSKRNGIPFWAFCLSTAHGAYPVPEMPHMKLEAFTALAYGAQGIQYFTYWTPDDKSWDWHHAPIDTNGKRTDTYYLIRDLNREIQSLSKVFLGMETDDVSHTGTTIPPGTKRLSSLPEGFGNLSSDGEGLLVSQFRNGKKKYLMLVNRDIHHAQTANLPRPAGLKRVNPDGSLSKDDGNPKITVAPGGYALFLLK